LLKKPLLVERARYGDLSLNPELSGFPEWIADDIATPQLKIRDGHAEAPERPGPGVELDEVKMGKWPVGTNTCE